MSAFEKFDVANFPLTAFAELETASPRNRFDCEFIYDKQPLIMDDISENSGTATHNATSRDIQLAVTGATDVGGMRAHSWIPYTPGSGQKCEITGTLDEAGIGGGTASCFLRSNVTGSVVETEVAQSSWDNAKTGVDWTTSHILAIPFQSLKVGTVFFYFVRSGVPVFLTQIDNDNIRATGYWQYASLPPYWKLYTSAGETIMEMGYGDDLNAVGIRYNLGTANYTATMRAICCTVKSQGGEKLEDLPGYPFVAEQLTPKTVSTTEIPLVSIQMAATFNSITNRTLGVPTGVEIQTDNPIFYRVRYRPTLTGASFGAIDAFSALNQDTTASAVSGGKIVDAGFIGTTKNTPADAKGILSRVLMSLGSTGTADILTLSAVRSGSTDASVLSAIKGKEIR